MPRAKLRNKKLRPLWQLEKHNGKMGDRDSRSRNSVPRHGVKDTAEKEKESEGGVSTLQCR